jgi:hypothetical protein
MNRTALFVSIALTTFVLLAIGGVVYILRPEPMAAAAEEAAPAETEVTLDPTEISPEMEQAWLEREAAYQKLIEDANTRLTELQQQLATQTATPQGDPATAAQQLTPEQAAQIAADYIGQSSVYWVQLIDLQGTSVYEVTFYAGDIVYVNLEGQVIGSAPAPIFASGGGGGGGAPKTSFTDQGGQDDDHGDDDDHEDHDDEHDDDHHDDHEDEDHD